ncbi:hypothetical protein Tco_1436206 [Tanacetum coccineum]
MWYDNWSGLGPLINSINHKKLYDARIDKNGYVADMLDNGGWKWPDEWYDTLPTITSIAAPTLSNSGDKITWVGNDGATNNFSMKQVYCDLKDNTEKKQMDLNVQEVEWNSIVNLMAGNPCSNSIGSIIKRLCFAATVYSIWQERNFRIFRGQSRDWKTVFKAICENVKCKLMGLKVKKSNAVKKVADIWNVKMDCIERENVVMELWSLVHLGELNVELMQSIVMSECSASSVLSDFI